MNNNEPSPVKDAKIIKTYWYSGSFLALSSLQSCRKYMVITTQKNVRINAIQIINVKGTMTFKKLGKGAGGKHMKFMVAT